jgi:hypothetical protein
VESCLGQGATFFFIPTVRLLIDHRHAAPLNRAEKRRPTSILRRV